MAGCATHWRTGDGVCQQCHDAEIASLRAKLAEAEKRAEHEHAEMQRQAQLAVDWMIDAQKATAACAEMRAALGSLVGECEEHGECPVCGTDTNAQLCRPSCYVAKGRALLARIDLGRGWVGPEVVRRVVERAVAPDGHCHLCIGVRGKHMEWCPVPDLDALLGDEKGGVK